MKLLDIHPMVPVFMMLNLMFITMQDDEGCRATSEIYLLNKHTTTDLKNNISKTLQKNTQWEDMMSFNQNCYAHVAY